MPETALIRLDAGSLEAEHICCALSSDKRNRERAALKKRWLAERFGEGHVFLKADIQGKAFIEYGPADKAWFPIEARGWLFAQCFWVAGRYAGTGLGARLLEAAEADAKQARGLCFLAAAKGKKPFLSDGRYLKEKGYEIVDEALGFALFAKATSKGAAPPRFADGAKTGRLRRASKGLDIYWSPQCPFIPPTAAMLGEAARAAGIPARLHEIDGPDSARALRAPPGMFQVYNDGTFVTHIPMGAGELFALIGAASGLRS